MSARDNHVKAVHGDMRQILPLHRSTLVDYEMDRMREELAAEHDLYAPSPLRIPRERAQTFGIWKALCGVVAVVLTIGLVAALWP